MSIVTGHASAMGCSEASRNWTPLFIPCRGAAGKVKSVDGTVGSVDQWANQYVQETVKCALTSSDDKSSQISSKMY